MGKVLEPHFWAPCQTYFISFKLQLQWDVDDGGGGQLSYGERGVARIDLKVTIINY